MIEFKVGDKVRCVDAGNAGQSLTKGNFYLVKSLPQGLVSVMNDRGTEEIYFSHRFELAEPKSTLVAPVECTTLSRTDVKLSFGSGLEITIDLSKKLALDLACAALAAYAKAAKQ